MNPQDFGMLMPDAVDEVFVSLSDFVKLAVHFRMDKNYGARKEKIPNRIGHFALANENIFGLCTIRLQSSITETFYGKVSVTFKCSKPRFLVFADHITEVKTLFPKSCWSSEKFG